MASERNALSFDVTRERAAAVDQARRANLSRAMALLKSPGLAGESAEAVHEALWARNPQDESEVPGSPLLEPASDLLKITIRTRSFQMPAENSWGQASTLLARLGPGRCGRTGRQGNPGWLVVLVFSLRVCFSSDLDLATPACKHDVTVSALCTAGLHWQCPSLRRSSSDRY